MVKWVMLFIRYKDNWADEMDVYGFAIMSQDSWREITRKVQEFFVRQMSGWTWGCGTNEQIEYDTYGSWVRCFKAVEINDEVADTMAHIFEQAGMRTGEGGNFPLYEGHFPIPEPDEMNEG